MSTRSLATLPFLSSVDYLEHPARGFRENVNRGVFTLSMTRKRCPTWAISTR